MAAYISRVKISNFRNFQELDVNLAAQAVLVGANKAGKSNFLHALRLVLDPTLPDSARQLRDEDFWDGLESPRNNNYEIRIDVFIKGFEGNQALLAILADYLVEEGVAKLSYLYKPFPSFSQNGEHVYQFTVFGGDEPENRFGYQQRLLMPLQVLPALRDAEGDLYSWRKSPLRPLIESLEVEEDELADAAAKIDEATDDLLDLDQIKSLSEKIESRLEQMVGDGHAVPAKLAVAPTDALRLLKSLRLYLDGNKQRSISDSSLGICNVIYLCLLSLELERQEERGERATTFLAIEEPEAHLHPQLQRLVFRDFFEKRDSVILTTHSPHIVSISPVKAFTVLKIEDDCSSGCSTVNAGLTAQEADDLGRYLDATRGEMLFAKGLIFVEGDAELYLIPELAAEMGHKLDELGITVCSVHGTDFLPYIKLVKAGALGIPFVVITDGDPKADGHYSVNRAKKIIKEAAGQARVTVVENAFEQDGFDGFVAAVAENNVYIGAHTLEVDLCRSGAKDIMVESYSELGASDTLRDRMANEIDEENFESMLGRIDRVGKGRFAQRLASKITADLCPDYIKNAIEKIVGV
jgi:putative ATP-dependent endonuclease of the OLD family